MNTNLNNIFITIGTPSGHRFVSNVPPQIKNPIIPLVDSGVIINFTLELSNGNVGF